MNLHNDLETEAAREQTQDLSQQFSLSSILWATTAVALLLAHARSLGTQSVSLLMGSAVFGLVSATLFSLMSRKPKEVFFWTCLIVVEAFLAVSAVRALGFSQASGWCLVGAVCGGYAAARLVQHRIWGSLLNGLLGGLSMLAVFRYFGESMDMERWLDLGGSIAVGIALWHFIEFLRWFQVSSGQTHVVVAAWLTLSVLIGNWAVRLYGY